MRARAFVAVAAVLVLLGGCGGTQTDALEQAAEATGAGTSRIAIRIVDGGEDIFTGSGEFDYANRVGRLTLEDPSGAHEEPTIESVFTGDAVYLKWSDTRRAKRWLKIELSEEDADAADPLAMFGGPLPFARANPAEILSFLQARSGEVKRIGSETVRRVETTHYRAMLDWDKVIAHAPEERREQLRAERDLLVGLFGMDIDVWIDAEMRARRMRFTSEPDPDDRVEFTVEFFDFGIKVAAAPPPADQTITEEELEKSISTTSAGECKVEPAERVEPEPAQEGINPVPADDASGWTAYVPLGEDDELPKGSVDYSDSLGSSVACIETVRSPPERRP